MITTTTLQTVALWTGPAMHCPFTSEISVKSKRIISITVMRYFYFLMSAITCVGPSRTQLLIPPILQFFLSPSINWRPLTTLLFDEKMLYETFLTLGLFRLLFCRTCDQAVLFLYCLGVYRTATLRPAVRDFSGNEWWATIWFSRPHFNQRGLCACHGFLVHFRNIC